jgi:tetratricopeptide (TPR) repeat protein
MPATPILALLSASAPERVAVVTAGIALQLVSEGFRVVVVDGDTLTAASSLGLSGATAGDGPGFSALLRGLGQPLFVRELSAKLPVDNLDRGKIGLVSALSEGETMGMGMVLGRDARDADAVEPLGRAMRHLSLGGEPPDIALLVLPVGENSLSQSLLSHLVDGALVLAQDDPADIDAVSDLLFAALKARRTALPTSRVELRKSGDAEGDASPTWLRRWRVTAEVVVPALPRPTKNLLTALRPSWKEGAFTELALSARRRVGVYHYDLAERVREAEADDLTEVAESAFAELRAKDKAAARAQFDAEIAPLTGTLLAGVAALNAVRKAPDVTFEELRHYAGAVLQKLRWAQPNPLSEQIQLAYERLRAELNAGHVARNPARVLIDAADALLHTGNWRRLIEQDHRPLARDAEMLLMLAATLEMRPYDSLRYAYTLSTHARLAGVTRFLPQAREALASLKGVIPVEKLLWPTTYVLGMFAQVYEDSELWQEMLVICHQLVPINPGNAHYSCAVAYAHLGERYNATEHLGKAIQVDIKFLEKALRDPDLQPLWEGAGSPYYAGRIPKSDKH